MLGPQFLPFIFLQNMLSIECSLALVLVLAVLCIRDVLHFCWSWNIRVEKKTWRSRHPVLIRSCSFFPCIESARPEYGWE